MALSEIDLGMQRPVIHKIQSSFSSSGEVFAKDSSLSQAIIMGAFSKVEITPEEAILYKTLREKPESLESDQALMAENVLNSEKSAQFKKAYPQIFPPLQ